MISLLALFILAGLVPPAPALLAAACMVLVLAAVLQGGGASLQEKTREKIMDQTDQVVKQTMLNQ